MGEELDEQQHVIDHIAETTDHAKASVDRTTSRIHVLGKN